MILVLRMWGGSCHNGGKSWRMESSKIARCGQLRQEKRGSSFVILRELWVVPDLCGPQRACPHRFVPIILIHTHTGSRHESTSQGYRYRRRRPDQLFIV